MSKLMLIYIVGLCLASVWAVPVDVHPSSTAPPVAILDSSQEKNQDGSYHFSYHGEDGTFREETAVVHNVGADNEFLEINGSYSYLDSDGKEVVVHYKADDHGFVPEGGNILPQISLAAKQASEVPHSVPDTSYEKPPKNNLN